MTIYPQVSSTLTQAMSLKPLTLFKMPVKWLSDIINGRFMPPVTEVGFTGNFGQLAEREGFEPSIRLESV
jgi:hypothetical protein